MVSIIFIMLFLVGIIYAIASGNIEQLNYAIGYAPKEAMIVFFETAYTIIFWSGILQICIDSKLVDFLCRGFVVMIHPLFHKLKKDDEALKYISMNLLSNMLCVGSAATPFGFKAFKRLDELNDYSEIASSEMITFMNLNSSCVCFLPVSLISTRNAYNAKSNSLVIIGVIVVGIFIMMFSIILNKVCEKYAKD